MRMPLLSVAILLLLVGCVEESGSGVVFGADGYSSLVKMTRVLIDYDLCESESGAIIYTGLDKNRNKILDSSEVTSQVVLCDGIDGQDGISGKDGQDGQNSILEIIDPCGSSGKWDEVLLKLSNGMLLCYFEDGNNRHLGILKPGHYRTTDSQNCNFYVDDDNTIYY